MAITSLDVGKLIPVTDFRSVQRASVNKCNQRRVESNISNPCGYYSRVFNKKALKLSERRAISAIRLKTGSVSRTHFYCVSVWSLFGTLPRAYTSHGKLKLE